MTPPKPWIIRLVHWADGSPHVVRCTDLQDGLEDSYSVEPDDPFYDDTQVEALLKRIAALETENALLRSPWVVELVRLARAYNTAIESVPDAEFHEGIGEQEAMDLLGHACEEAAFK